MSNSDSIEVTASTVEQAISEALEKLGAAEDDVAIEILATPRSGVLGLGARDARVRVVRKAPSEARSGVAEPPPAPPVPPQPSRPVQQQQAEAKPAAPRAPKPRTTPEPEPARQREPEPARQREPEPPRRAEEPRAAAEPAEEEAAEGARQVADVEEQVREASSVLKQILELMGEKTEVERIGTDPESIELEVKGDGSGILIGRHGQTLDALEYLVNRVVARRIKDGMPIVLDTESYRARRRQQLERMALSMGERAKREHEPVKLDPMPPRDRRIIHLALKDDPLVSTRSSGEGFLRSVEIMPTETRPREHSERGKRPERERPGAIGEQGGFKHGQKKLL